MFPMNMGEIDEFGFYAIDKFGRGSRRLPNLRETEFENAK